MSDEMKSVLENTKRANEALATLQSKMDEIKGEGDVIARNEIAKIRESLKEALEAKAAAESRMTALETQLARPGAAVSNKFEDEHKDAFIAMLRRPDDMERRARLQDIVRKSVNITTDANGGYAVPSVIAAEIANVATDLGVLRQIARVVNVSTAEYSELLNNSNSSSEWVGDTDTRNVTNAATIASVTPTFGELSAVVDISLQSLEDMVFDASAWVTQELGAEFARKEAEAFLTGNGTKKPTGLMTNTSVAKIKTGDANTIVTADTLIKATYALKKDYRPNASWLMNSTTQALLATLKDKNDNYLISNLVAGVPTTLLGRPVYLDEGMADVAANALPIAYGDFKRGYLIADRVGITVLLDPYSNTGFLRVKGRRRVGGIVKDAAALRFIEVKV